MYLKNEFSREEMDAFAPSEKIGLIACLNPDGLVHMALITSIMAPRPGQVTLGQFCTGLSKYYIQTNPDVAFLIMSLDRKLWRGRARWTHKKESGPEFEFYNNQPMFRYNAYFGINTVHYLDLIETYGRENLPMGRIIPAAVMTRIAKGAARSKGRHRILKPFAENLFNQLASLKFLGFIAKDGSPAIVPLIQCQAADNRRLAFSDFAFKDELAAIEPGTQVAVYALNLKMQNVLVRGKFRGFSRRRLFNTGLVDIDWVYNSMPPAHGQIYPEPELRPVSEF